MTAVDLEIKDGGIYPVGVDAMTTVQELRSRTVLAYGYLHDHLTLIESDLTLGKIITLVSSKDDDVSNEDKLHWELTHHYNTGYIEVDKTTVGWNFLPRKMLLYVKPDTDVNKTLRQYFAVPLKFLEERQHVKRSIARAYGEMI